MFCADEEPCISQSCFNKLFNDSPYWKALKWGAAQVQPVDYDAAVLAFSQPPTFSYQSDSPSLNLPNRQFARATSGVAIGSNLSPVEVGPNELRTSFVEPNKLAGIMINPGGTPITPYASAPFTNDTTTSSATKAAAGAWGAFNDAVRIISGGNLSGRSRSPAFALTAGVKYFVKTLIAFDDGLANPSGKCRLGVETASGTASSWRLFDPSGPQTTNSQTAGAVGSGWLTLVRDNIYMAVLEFTPTTSGDHRINVGPYSATSGQYVKKFHGEIQKETAGITQPVYRYEEFPNLIKEAVPSARDADHEEVSLENGGYALQFTYDDSSQEWRWANVVDGTYEYPTDLKRSIVKKVDFFTSSTVPEISYDVVGNNETVTYAQRLFQGDCPDSDDTSVKVATNRPNFSRMLLTPGLLTPDSRWRSELRINAGDRFNTANFGEEFYFAINVAPVMDSPLPVGKYLIFTQLHGGAYVVSPMLALRFTRSTTDSDKLQCQFVTSYTNYDPATEPPTSPPDDQEVVYTIDGIERNTFSTPISDLKYLRLIVAAKISRTKGAAELTIYEVGTENAVYQNLSASMGYVAAAGEGGYGKYGIYGGLLNQLSFPVAAYHANWQFTNVDLTPLHMNPEPIF